MSRRKRPSRSGAVAGRPRRIGDAARSTDGATPAAAATAQGHDGIAAFLTAASSWPAFKILVACRLADDAKRGLRIRPARSPCAAPPRSPSWSPPARARRTRCGRARPTSARPRPGWSTTPWGPWAPARHFLFHAGVRSHVRVVLLCGIRLQARRNIPSEVWRFVCGFFGLGVAGRLVHLAVLRPVFGGLPLQMHPPPTAADPPLPLPP